MAYHIAFDGSLVVIKLSGTISRADLDGVGTDLFAIERGGTFTPPRLTDLREAQDSTIGYPDVARLAERSIARPLSAPVRAALLVDKPAQLGFARMFQTLNQHPLVTLQVFEDEQAARDWLAEPAPKPSPGANDQR